MGSNYDRNPGRPGEHSTGQSTSPASLHDELVPDFRGLLRRAADDLRTEASGHGMSDQRDRLLRLAAMLDRYADDSV